MNKINAILVIGIPPLFFLLIVWGVILSHRFAGPIERMEGEIKKVSDSRDYRHRIRVRKNDDLKGVANAFNGLLDKLEGK